MNDSIAEIVDEVKRSLCKDCWYVSCGGAASTTFELALGRKIPRGCVVHNSAHTEEFCNFKGEANLLVWCTWRLDDSNSPLTSSDDGVDHVVEVLKQLVGRDVVNVRVDLPGWDLHLDFSGGWQLHVFCDHIAGDPSFSGNWELALTDKVIEIDVSSELRIRRDDH